MKRVCKRPVQIDALTICYSLADISRYDSLQALGDGEVMEVGELRLRRYDGRYFENVFSIDTWDGEHWNEWGALKYGISKGDSDSNTHSDGTRKVWITLKNRTLYSDEIYYLTYIEQVLGLDFHNFTSLDLALDTNYNVGRTVKSLLHNRNVETILNGRRIEDRAEDRREISYTYSGSLNEHTRYLSVNVKQRKAIRNKSNGITLLMYDKKAEIRNSSEKDYIIDYYGNPKHLFRTEVHLQGDDVRNFAERCGRMCNPNIIFDRALLEAMFLHYLGSVLRFKGGSGSDWGTILGHTFPVL